MAIYPPVLVRPFTDQVFRNGARGSWVGPVAYGSALYLPLMCSTTPDAIAIYKSADGGNTWAVVDPSGGYTGSTSWTANLYDAGAAKIRYAMLDTSKNVRLQAFDLATETWGAVVNAGPIGSVFVPKIQHYFRTPAGTDVVVVKARATSGGNDQYYWCAIQSGVMTAYSLIDTDPGLTWFDNCFPISGGAMDSNGIVHYFYTTNVTVKNKYLQINGDAGTATSPVEVLDYATYQQTEAMGSGAVIGANLFLPAWSWAYGYGCIKVSPFNSATPTITFTYIPVPIDHISFPECFMTQSGSTVYLTANQNYTYSEVTQISKTYYSKSTDGGATWSPPTLLHDEVAVPTTVNAWRYQTYTSAAILPGGVMGVCENLETYGLLPANGVFAMYFTVQVDTSLTGISTGTSTAAASLSVGGAVPGKNDAMLVITI